MVNSPSTVGRGWGGPRRCAIRKQWQAELTDKFNLPAVVIDRKVWNQRRKAGSANPFDGDEIVIVSYGFAARMKEDLGAMPFDLVVMDEAHKLRNAYQRSRKAGQAVRWAFEPRPKILLTATPLQNSLLELYGLGWLIDEHIFGDKNTFQSRYCNMGGDIVALRNRLSQFWLREALEQKLGTSAVARTPAQAVAEAMTRRGLSADDKVE